MCGAVGTDRACPPNWGGDSWGGEDALHPLHPDLRHWLDELGGLGFSDVHAKPVRVPRLPGFIPQLRTRSALRGHLTSGAYALRPGEVLRERGVLGAAELRKRLGLRPEQALILLPFADDDELEDLWDEERLDQIAEANFDLTVGPSYSLWEPRPRTQHMVSLKRSLVFFKELQERDISAIPRVAWVTGRDLRRMAQWVRANPCVGTVALDWQTYAGWSTFRQQLTGLVTFDRLTGQRLRYLINGPAPRAALPGDLPSTVRKAHRDHER